MSPDGDAYVGGDLPGLDSDLPGLDKIDRAPDPSPTDYDDADLPGLDEIDIPPDPKQTSDTSPRPADPSPTEEPARQWTHEELDDWFENDFGGDKAFDREFGYDTLTFTDRLPKDFREAVQAYRALSQPFWRVRVFRPEAEDYTWRTLSHGMKEQFRTGFSEWGKPDEPPDAPPDELNPDSVVDELAPLPIIGEPLPILGDEPAGSSSPAIGSFKWLMMGAGAALVALSVGAALLLMDDSDDPEDAAATTTAETAETITTTTASTTSEEDASNPPSPSATPDQPVESPVTGSTYTATKIADLVADGVREPAPIGTSYETTLLLDETCTGDVCSYQSTFDLEFHALADLEWGQREAASWEVNGSSWTAEMSASYAYIDDPAVGTCVVILQELWELTVTDTRVIDSDTTAATFTGTMTRSDSFDQSVSTQGVDITGQPICPFDGTVADEWSVAGVAVISPAEAP